MRRGRAGASSSTTAIEAAPASSLAPVQHQAGRALGQDDASAKSTPSRMLTPARNGRGASITAGAELRLFDAAAARQARQETNGAGKRHRGEDQRQRPARD